MVKSGLFPFPWPTGGPHSVKTQLKYIYIPTIKKQLKCACIYIYEPFGLGRFATDYSTASRSRVTHNNVCKLVSISLTNDVTIHLIL